MYTSNVRLCYFKGKERRPGNRKDGYNSFQQVMFLLEIKLYNGLKINIEPLDFSRCQNISASNDDYRTAFFDGVERITNYGDYRNHLTSKLEPT